MSFFSLVIMIYIIIAIAKSVREAKERDTASGNATRDSQRKTPLDTFRGSYRESDRGSYQVPTDTSRETKKPTATYAEAASKSGKSGKPEKSGKSEKQSSARKAAAYGSTSGSTYQQSATAPKTESRQSAEQSTVDYLAQKAEQEQETQNRAAKISALSQKDGHRVAVRLLEGDLPPAGTRVIKCSYCGAENLIPHNATGKFACYFCREDL